MDTERPPSGWTGYLAADGFLDDLLAELGPVRAVEGRLVLADGPPRRAAWAQNIWYDPEILPVASIGDAARQLKAIQRNWAAYAPRLHRRTALVGEKLPPVSARPLVFGQPAPTAPLGSWCFLDETTVLAARRCSSPFPHGEVRFVEDRQTPPNRAYLKLWDAFTTSGVRPRPGDLCLDLGASPGGWTWVLQSVGARVISVDKAPLDPAIAALPNVSCLRQSAFAVEPRATGPVDWLFSDVICYPSRLLTYVERWLASGLVGGMLCTLKFQGDTDHDTAAKFAAIPGGKLMHLAHNKHELTWLWQKTA
ncbi:ribosomal RNA large subunit methyltransferase M [mine drainage metagenome]|uniref:Ribosomal RNA large subunit methyltransferase M n=1 Tax=mine drainage metagenome TaxID=410659 RepID=A0A1J5SV34_9ZZZZ